MYPAIPVSRFFHTPNPNPNNPTTQQMIHTLSQILSYQGRGSVSHHSHSFSHILPLFLHPK